MKECVSINRKIERSNCNAFTLIELLAIIVILAVISVITVPIILNVIDSAKEKAAIDSSIEFKNSIYNGFMSELMLNSIDTLPSGVFAIDENGRLVDQDGFILSINISGTVPSEGWVALEKGQVVEYSLRFGDYVVTKHQDTEPIAVKNADIAENADAMNVLAIANQDIRITNVSISNVSGGAYETYKNKFNRDSMFIYATLPANSLISYEIEITNKSVINYDIAKIEKKYNSNSDVDINISLNVGDTISGNSAKKFTITLTNNTDSEITEVLAYEYAFKEKYKESLLNGSYPIYSNGLVPIVIESDGTVRRADIYSEWYSYADKRWANAVVLFDDVNYNAGDIIPESNIESYFVWIPKYSYKLFDMGNYTSYKSNSSSYTEKSFPIEIMFGTSDTVDSSSECATPLVSGTSDNCNVGKYMTHPAFITLGSNGFWIGKFETGYLGASNVSASSSNSYNSSKVVIKPDVYSWHNISVTNAYKNSFNYMRDLDSHLVKNTEWGAAAYLSNSIYGVCSNGSCNEVRFNNNSDLKTGYGSLTSPTCGWSDDTNMSCRAYGKTSQYTSGWLSESGKLSSSTGNITGVYDMSGGLWEHVAGFVLDSSNSTPIISSIPFSSDKYYDGYAYTSTSYKFDIRILGDATGEMGPFFYTKYVNSSNTAVSRTISNWNYDYSYFMSSSRYCIVRGGDFISGSDSGPFAFHTSAGSANNYWGFRIALTLYD